MSFVEQYLLQLNTEKRRFRYAVVILTVLSFTVALVTVWNLRITGVTIANDATCSFEEHLHTEECLTEKVLVCDYSTENVAEEPLADISVTSQIDINTVDEIYDGSNIDIDTESTEIVTYVPHEHTDSCYKIEYLCGLNEHVHDLLCFSDPKADVETSEIWEKTLPELVGEKASDALLIAKSQLGYTESERNYILAEDGQSKRGITRYGQWYGNPYGDWANMFTSFCLRYSGVSEDLLNSGAEVMLADWKKENLYCDVYAYAPCAGDVVFLDKNKNGSVDTTAIAVSLENGILTVVEGDFNNSVSQNAYTLSDGFVTGYGITSPESRVMMYAAGDTQVSLWLDGTNGNIMSYRGSDNTKYMVYSGVESQLPTQWKSPTKYSYKLAGWVNIKTGDYYKPGANITITENTVLYADWVATTYDIGQYNSYVANTISTSDFITTKVFDYSSLINLNSSKVSVNVSSTNHSESWSHVSAGNVSYKGQPTLNFSFNDHDSSGALTNLNNLNNPNKYTGGTAVYPGIYNTTLDDALFSTDNLFNPDTGTGIVGKHYLGEGDHLFQINTDPNSEHFGYYYYDAKLNAASYNQADQRFYVYDYLSRTSDSANNNDAGKYSDFLPLNSPYANTNGQTIKTYNYAGDNGEYSGVSHYMYDARYDSNSSSANQIKANLWFGMKADVQFGLSDVPGTKLPNGDYGNKDLYGNDMHFKFTGDDDVWILVDGNVVLDLGGIHQAAEGDINFSSGEIRVNGKSAGTLSGIDSGEHTLTILYLERGSSMSNCAIYFNLAPRFSLTLQKEDVLTQEILNGAQFALYNDLACTDPCELWQSQQSYKNGDEPTNIFTIEDGTAYIWGLSPSRTYYIKEISPPNANGYLPANGVIQITLDKKGLNSYSATILNGVDAYGNEISVSHGFTLHGFRIDEESQDAYIIITNAQNWVTETTSIYVEKRWNDNENHSQDAVTVYLNVTDPDGTVRRIREISLSEENDWKYTWTNLPKYALDSDTMLESDILLQYSVSEAYVSGYSPTIKKLENGTYTIEDWAESEKFSNGDKYILKTSQGYLSTTSSSNKTLCFVDESVAKTSTLALWTATVSSGKVKLTNQEGQSINYFASGSTRYYNATNGSTSSQNLSTSNYSNGIRLYYKSGTRSYYLGNLNKNNYAEATTSLNSALTIYPMLKTVTTTTIDLKGYGYAITNTPLTTETSLKVVKRWDHPTGDSSFYEKEQVTIKLIANGVDSGRTETVNLKNNWTAIFNGLPYLDEAGNTIVYTVVESWETQDWIPVYGAITTVEGETPTYSTSVTNIYRWTGSYELPSTGGTGNYTYILCGLLFTLVPLVYGFILRRRHMKRRSKH